MIVPLSPNYWLINTWCSKCTMTALDPVVVSKLQSRTTFEAAREGRCISTVYLPEHPEGWISWHTSGQTASCNRLLVLAASTCIFGAATYYTPWISVGNSLDWCCYLKVALIWLAQRPGNAFFFVYKLTKETKYCNYDVHMNIIFTQAISMLNINVY